MIKLNTISLFIAASLFSLGSLAADFKSVTPKVEYSADQVMETQETAISGKIHITPTKERREMNIEGESMIMILRRDKKTAWNLMPSEQMYMEMAFDQAAAQTENLDNFKIETTAMGNETVNGVACEKSKVIMTNLKTGDKMGGFWWMTKDNIVMKMDMLAKDKKDGKLRMKLELSNLKVGKQNASLFEIPAGYSKMSMPDMGSLQDMMRGGQEAESAGDKKENKGGFNFNDALKLMR